MADKNKSYRIRTKVGREADTFLDVHLDQDYDSLEILSLKISDKDVYKLHNSDYGVIVGRVIANGNFGVPNAKISVFIPADEQNSSLEMWNLYPYTTTTTKNDKNIRYNLLPDESVKDCHKAVGTFPNKTFLLDNDSTLEVFDQYYIYTTRTNAAGDYMICGVPTGSQTLHMDLDLSDCGILSQRPRDFVYKGYTIEQFENPNQFKKDENIDGLSQIFSQNQPVHVQPFWGNEDNGDEIGITRADFEIAFKFEPTCVFMGSAISDNNSNGVGKKCVPTNQMGLMDELTAGEGTIEMIRKTPGGNVEEFSIRGNQLIDGNGVWCYQIPMNLDYMMTDEYGNMVPTDDPEKGIPTRARVRFRASLTDMEDSSQSYYRAKYLIPNNPSVDDRKVDYNFGTYTDESSYRDLFWNGVYTVKSYIPRFQKSKRWKSERFSGIKACNYYGPNNPMPYNNLRIKLPFMFTVLCIIVQAFVKIVSIVNRIVNIFLRIVFLIEGATRWIPVLNFFTVNKVEKVVNDTRAHCLYVGDGLCPDMEGWYFSPSCMAWTPRVLSHNNERSKSWDRIKKLMFRNTLEAALGHGDDITEEGSDNVDSTQYIDETSLDWRNKDKAYEESVCLTTDVDYLLNCFEMALAQEYRVIKFDFYNDWVNGVIYFPRWMRKVKRKKKYKFSWKRISEKPTITTYYKDKVQGCMNAENSTAKKSRYYTQQCSISYEQEKPDSPYNIVTTPMSCTDARKTVGKLDIYPMKCHKKKGMMQSSVFGRNNGLVTEETTMLGQYVYYLKPCEWKETENGVKRTILFATDIVLLGTLNDCDENGIPQAFKYLSNSSYIMPTNLALTTMDDDSYIYATSGGTICISKNATPPTAEPYDNVNRITPDYVSTYNAYKNSGDDKIEYGENDDPIPVTEAAGITWNYSGPGQDDVALGEIESPKEFKDRMFGRKKRNSRKYLYYPGGHFLGLTCVDSETNIKSCVNLKRICELGATMSQRREEVRGYDGNGNPKYRYYVPTGLISNVDIETASFRSMFATINHNKLIATKTNETTGYKVYDFRFLRPDGFDGSLKQYIHKGNSPYNTVVNTIENPGAIKDATTFFERVFKGIWSRPDDYDPNEIEFTERRTVETSIDDYFMFRFGLDGFSDVEQKKHFLSKKDGGLSLPQYENSFYFYFGLKDGATALDEFKKQFFSECESNTVMGEPDILVDEEISDDLATVEAKIIISNMVGPYTVKISDNSLGISTDPFPLKNDVFDLEDEFNENADVTGYTIAIGREYTVTVTDSLDRTVTKTFVFGESTVDINVSVVPFRFKVQTSTSNSEPKMGGYIKVNDKLTILGEEHSISQEVDRIRFKFRKVTDGSEGQFITPNKKSYVDSDGQTWHLYFFTQTGTHNVYLEYDGANVSVYTAKVEDNSSVNLYLSCDFMSYKKDEDKPTAGLSALTETQWLNDPEVFSGPRTNINPWLMRHSLYRQTQDDTAPYDNHIYASSEDYNIAIFGQPESGDTLAIVPTGETEYEMAGLYPGRVSFYKGSYDAYEGYSVDEKYELIPTMYWSAGTETTSGDKIRNTFDAMSYTDDGRAASDALQSVTISSYTYSDGVMELVYSGQAQNLLSGHGCIVVFENGKFAFPIVQDSSTMVAHTEFDAYPSYIDNETNATIQRWTAELLSMASVYPTMCVPSFYKPFYGEVTGVVWNNYYAEIIENNDGGWKCKKEKLPTSYKVEGSIHNGLTFNNRFFKGEPDEGTSVVTNYDTYMIFENKPNFYNALTATTSDDYKPKREIKFGYNGWVDGFCREISNPLSQPLEDVEDFDELVYKVTEGVPPTIPASHENILTERYADGFDKVVLTDSCSIYGEFYNDIKIRVFEETKGLTGICSLYTEEQEIEGMKVYLTRENLFNYPDFIISEAYERESTLPYYTCGYFNERAKYDKKGSETTLTPFGGDFLYTVTNENGVKVRKYGSESDVANDGIAIYSASSINPQLRNNLTNAVRNAINNGREIDLEFKSKAYDTGETYYTTSAIMSWNAIIQVYEREDIGNKNKMLIYNLIPLRSLSVLFPLGIDGVDPDLSATANETNFGVEGGHEEIRIQSNIDFTITCQADWIILDGGNTYPAGTTSAWFTVIPNNIGEGPHPARYTTINLKSTRAYSTEDNPTPHFIEVNIEIHQDGTE